MLPGVMDGRNGYREGIAFECQGCGNCCRTHGEYAYVFLNQRDVTAIAEYLDMTRIAFLNAFCATDDEGCIYLKKIDGDCDFLTSDAGCRIYPVRPKQCATWPFWTENLDDETWHNAVAPACPGIGQGRRYAKEEIEAICRARDDWYEDG